MKRPFIIDCDTGTDDAVMLCAALGCEEIAIRAVTSVNGNAREEAVAKNNLDLLTYFGAEIPVARGAGRPILYKDVNDDLTHGGTGLGNVKVPASKKKYADLVASELIYQTACEEDGKLELLLTGPMTNLAISIVNHPDLPGRIRHLYFMGGAISGGNMNTCCEYNSWVDPVAGHIVLTSGIPAVTMVGLDVTLKAVMEREDAERLASAGTPRADIASQLLFYMMERRNRGGEDVLMHDALALCAAVHPSCLSFRDYSVDVEYKGNLTAGCTVADLYGRNGKKPNVSAAMELDVADFRAWLLRSILREKN